MPVSGIDNLRNLQGKLKTLVPTMQRQMVRHVENDAVVIADINRDYLEFGIKPDGSEIQPRGYSRSYAAYKLRNARYKNISFVDLKFDGHFHESITFEHVASENFRIKSTRNKPYFKGLFERYGNLIGVRQKDMDNYVNTRLIPILEGEINKLLT